MSINDERYYGFMLFFCKKINFMKCISNDANTIYRYYSKYNLFHKMQKKAPNFIKHKREAQRYSIKYV